MRDLVHGKGRAYTTRLGAGLLLMALISAPAAAGATEPRSASSPRTMLNSLDVLVERPTGYDRNLFEHWVDQDGDGCDTRREVLLEEALTKPSVAANCWIDGGTWVSLYDGQERSGYPSDFDVDHLVPLAEVWRSGGYKWSSENRRNYANDTVHPETLIAVTASTNRSKSDKGPEEWLPPRKQARCGYVLDWIRIKYTWDLAVDRREKRVLLATLKTCPVSASLAGN